MELPLEQVAGVDIQDDVSFVASSLFSSVLLSRHMSLHLLLPYYARVVAHLFTRLSKWGTRRWCSSSWRKGLM
jgi:hypothetical protein